ncbi:uncharacterized protein LOC144657598 [Oculina patagonica]
MVVYLFVFKAYLLCSSLFTRSVFSDEEMEAVCPQFSGGYDHYCVNERVKKLASQGEYFTDDYDMDYRYGIKICQEADTYSDEDRAVRQYNFYKPPEPWATIGKFEGAYATGGNNWLMIKYFPGENSTKCASGERAAVRLIIICDRGEHRGSLKVIDDPSYQECSYLFELNHEAACFDFKRSSNVYPTDHQLFSHLLYQNWLMIKYFYGPNSPKCAAGERAAVLIITCDRGKHRGSQKNIDDPSYPECSYLFELNQEAACFDYRLNRLKAKESEQRNAIDSPFSIHENANRPQTLFTSTLPLIVVGSVCLILGFLYQRFVVGAQGLEQIPNYIVVYSSVLRRRSLGSSRVSWGRNA